MTRRLVALGRLTRWRLARSVRAVVRRIVPRELRETRPVFLRLDSQTHGVVMRSRVNLTLRAAVLASHGEERYLYARPLTCRVCSHGQPWAGAIVCPSCLGGI